MTKALPLAGLRIAVTRPREQSVKLSQGIETLGGICIQFPLLEITPLVDKQALYDVAARLHEFHLAIFISPNAVRYGMEAIKDKGRIPATLQVATVGKSSAKALHECGVAKVISPHHRFDSEALLALPELQNVSHKKVVIFRGDPGRELLGDTLKLRGATVEYVTCYHRQNPHHDIADLLAALPDVLSVSSSEALSNLHEMMNQENREIIYSIPIFTTHDRIAAAARTLGWQNILVAAGGDESLLSELVLWAVKNKVQNYE